MLKNESFTTLKYFTFLWCKKGITKMQLRVQTIYIKKDYTKDQINISNVCVCA